MKLHRTAYLHLINAIGWKTNRKLLVIESDDWGSIRMPSKAVYNTCLSKGYRVDLSPYTKYDNLASSEDLSFLFELLSSFRDQKGNHPVITANSLVANPNFEKIKQNGFKEYSFELLDQTYARYGNNHTHALKLWKEGQNKGIFFPQSHGREHLNVALWMHALQNKNKDNLFAFDYGMPGIFGQTSLSGGNQYVKAFNHSSIEDEIQKSKIAANGLSIFEEFFGYASTSFIAPNYIWGDKVEQSLAQNKVTNIQGIPIQLKPRINGKSPAKKIHYFGSKNKYGQIYTFRNAFFEPSITPQIDWVDECLNRIEIAFKWNKPAIIGTHRINFVGSLFPHNRDQNLKQFKILLEQILKKWPDVEFITSAELGRLMTI